MDDNLRIRPDSKLMALGYQLPTELRIIEDLAIESDPDGIVLVAKRLAPAFNVNNG